MFARIFVTDPNRRIAIEEIQTHAWYLRNLPPELAPGAAALRSAEMAARLQTAEELQAILDSV